MRKVPVHGAAVALADSGYNGPAVPRWNAQSHTLDPVRRICRTHDGSVGAAAQDAGSGLDAVGRHYVVPQLQLCRPERAPRLPRSALVHRRGIDRTELHALCLGAEEVDVDMVAVRVADV